MAGPTSFQETIYNVTGSRIGKPERTFSWFNSDESVRIHVAEVADAPDAGLTSYYTVGLGAFSSQMTTGDGDRLGVEFVMAAAAGQALALSGIGNCALNVATGDYAGRLGAIYPNIFGSISTAVTTPHGLLWLPSSWPDEFEGIELEDVHVEWLQIIPLTSDERRWVAQHGPGQVAVIDQLLEAFAAQDVDIYDLSRPSVKR